MENLSASRSNQILALLAVAQLMGVLNFSLKRLCSTSGWPLLPEIVAVLLVSLQAVCRS